MATDTNTDTNAIFYAACAGGIGFDDCADLCRAARVLHNLDEAAARRELAFREESRLRRLENKVVGIASGYPDYTLERGDPRGAIKLHRPSDGTTLYFS
jgi:hypothetical protein